MIGCQSAVVTIIASNLLSREANEGKSRRELDVAVIFSRHQADLYFCRPKPRHLHPKTISAFAFDDWVAGR
jgi:hypothetical protein